MLQACLNGARTLDECRSLPVTPAQLAAEAAGVVAAGAQDVHLHPKDVNGIDSLEPEPVAQSVMAVRSAVPARVRVGVTTGAWTARDPEQRAALIGSWTILPDHASVNWHEDGAELVAQVLLDRGVAVEAGIFSGTDAVHRFRSSPLSQRVLRVLAEVTDTNPATAAATAAALVEDLGESTVPVLLHGEDEGAWPVLRMAARSRLDTRIGLEDVLVLPDGSAPTGNAQLVEAALTILGTP